VHYHDADDLKKIGELKALAPEEIRGFVELDKIIGVEDGAIPRKYRELIAIAVSCTTQCPYCLDVHTAVRNALAPPGKKSPKPRCSLPPSAPELPRRTVCWL